MTTIATTKDALSQAKTRMEKAVEDFRKDLASVRTGRANVALLDHIRVDYHGTPMPINQLGNLTIPDPMMIVISPWDPGAVPLVDKAIRTSDLGLNPANDGKVIRVPIPPLTEERRKELVKHIHKVLENRRQEAFARRTREGDPLGNEKDRGPLRRQRKRSDGNQVTTRRG